MAQSPIILIVEDDIDARELLLDWFETWQIRAHAVPDAEEALRVLELQAYNAILIDLALPGLDGTSLLEKIRGQKKAYVPCVAMTAFDNNSVRHHSLEAGFDAYLEKPLNEKALFETVTRVLVT